MPALRPISSRRAAHFHRAAFSWSSSGVADVSSAPFFKNFLGGFTGLPPRALIAPTLRALAVAELIGAVGDSQSPNPKPQLKCSGFEERSFNWTRQGPKLFQHESWMEQITPDPSIQLRGPFCDLGNKLMSCLHLHGSHKGQVGEGRPLNSLGERIIEHRQGQDPTSPSVIVLSHDRCWAYWRSTSLIRSRWWAQRLLFHLNWGCPKHKSHKPNQTRPQDKKKGGSNREAELTDETLIHWSMQLTANSGPTTHDRWVPHLGSQGWPAASARPQVWWVKSSDRSRVAEQKRSKPVPADRSLTHTLGSLNASRWG